MKGMRRMFKASAGHFFGLEAVEIERTTERYVVLLNGRKEAKNSRHRGPIYQWCETEHEAYEWLYKYYARKLSQAQKDLNETHATLLLIAERELIK